MRFDEHFVKHTLSDVSILNGTFPEDADFVVDTRILRPGDIFVALAGTRCDGHGFIADAFAKGAAGVIIMKGKESCLHAVPKETLEDKLIMVVKDPFQAIIDMAFAWRSNFSYPVIGITGTVGKTSVKECLSHIFHLHGAAYLVSRENQNTLLGAALNILRMRDRHTIAIFEMGISHRNEMARLAHLVRPTTAIITNIGHQHMDGLGSLNDIVFEKRDIFKYFVETNIGIVNGDNQILADVSYPHPVVKFGSKMTNQIQARKIRVNGAHISFILKIYGKKYPVVVKRPHTGVIMNSLAAAAAAHLLGVPDATIVEAIQMPMVVGGRFEECPLKNGRGIIISDCYNANPESMKAALLAFQQIETKAQKIAVLGDMLGLGVNSPFWHRQIGRFLRKVPSVRKVILVGTLVEWIKKTIPYGVAVEMATDWQDAARKLEPTLTSESVVLVKGSHDLLLNNLVEQFAK